MMAEAPLLETRGLTMRFGGVTAVDGADFALAEPGPPARRFRHRFSLCQRS